MAPQAEKNRVFCCFSLYLSLCSGKGVFGGMPSEDEASEELLSFTDNVWCCVWLWNWIYGVNYEIVFLQKWLVYWKGFSNCRTTLKLTQMAQYPSFWRHNLKITVFVNIYIFWPKKNAVIKGEIIKWCFIFSKTQISKGKRNCP